MNGLDILLALLLIGAALYGYNRGMIRQVAGVLAWIAGVAIAFGWSDGLRGRLEQSLDVSAEWSGLVSFLVIGIAASLILKMIGLGLHWFIARLPVLRVANSLMGAPIGMISAALLIGTATVILEWNPGDSWAKDAVQRSVIATRLSRLMQSVVEIDQLQGD